MPVTVTVIRTLDDTWGLDEELEKLSDAEIIELVREDVNCFLDGACINVEKH